MLTRHPGRNQGRAGFEVLATGEEEGGHGNQEEDNQRDGDEKTAAGEGGHDPFPFEIRLGVCTLYSKVFLRRKV